MLLRQELSMIFGNGISPREIGHCFPIITHLSARELGMDSRPWMILCLLVVDTTVTLLWGLTFLREKTPPATQAVSMHIFKACPLWCLSWCRFQNVTNNTLHSHLTDYNFCQSHPSGRVKTKFEDIVRITSAIWNLLVPFFRNLKIKTPKYWSENRPIPINGVLIWSALFQRPAFTLVWLWSCIHSSSTDFCLDDNFEAVE